MKQIEKIVQDYLNDTSNIRFNSLLSELIDYQPQYMINKAIKIYRVCVERNKFDLADKIHKKYRLDKNRKIKDDIVMSAGYLFKNESTRL